MDFLSKVSSSLTLTPYKETNGIESENLGQLFHGHHKFYLSFVEGSLPCSLVFEVLYSLSFTYRF